MLRKLVLGLALAAASALPLAGVAEAAVGDGVVAAPSLSPILQVEQAQFFFGGQNYCFYPDGWHGPGFYWCGYAYRTGFGWGGGPGWHGWHGGGGRRFGGGGGMHMGGGHMHMGGGMGGGHMHMGGGHGGGGGGHRHH